MKYVECPFCTRKITKRYFNVNGYCPNCNAYMFSAGLGVAFEATRHAEWEDDAEMRKEIKRRKKYFEEHPPPPPENFYTYTGASTAVTWIQEEVKP